MALDHEAYAGLVKDVFARFRNTSTPITRAQDVAEAVWRAATDPSSPMRIPAGADAEAWAARFADRAAQIEHGFYALQRMTIRRLLCRTNKLLSSPGRIKESVFRSAKDLAACGLTVLVGSRSLGRGEAAAREVGLDAFALQLDVTDQASITSAAERVRNEFGRLDVLVQNAAISNTKKSPVSPSRSTPKTTPRATWLSMKCAQCGTPTCSACSLCTRRCCRFCARRRAPAS